MNLIIYFFSTGSYHESELYYIFGFPHMNLQNALRLKEDKQVADIMIQLWTDFAKTGYAYLLH